LPVPDDYFVRSNDLSLNVTDKKLHDQFLKFLKNPKPNKPTKTAVKFQTALELYKDYDTRVFIDAMILNHNPEDAALVFKVEKSVIDIYRKIFFDYSDFETNKASLVRFISVNDVAEWFIFCKKHSAQEIVYALRHEKDESMINMADGLKEIFDHSMREWRAYGKLPPQAILSGLSEKDKSLYEVGHKAALRAEKIAKTYFHYYDIINKNEASFAEQWKILLFGNSVKDYEDDVTLVEGGSEENLAEIDRIKGELGEQLAMIEPQISPADEGKSSD
jgi:hypothetical protein